MSVSFSFVIPYYNSKSTINDCIKSITSQKFKANFEIIIVDNNSIYKAQDFIEDLSSCIIIDEPNQGRSFARNAGAQRAKYPYICFIDSDVVLSSGWTTAAENFISKTHFDAYECSVQNVDRSDKQTFLGIYRDLFRGGRYNIEDHTVRKFPVINSACCIYKRSSFLEIEGFDPELNWFEDADLSKRMFLCGGNLSIIPYAECQCYFDGGLWDYIKRKYRAGRLGILYLTKWEKELESPAKILWDVLKKFVSPFERAIDMPINNKRRLIIFHRFLLLVNFIGHLFSRIQRIKHSKGLNITQIQHQSKLINPEFNLVLTRTNAIIKQLETSKMFIKKTKIMNDLQTNSPFAKEDYFLLREDYEN